MPSTELVELLDQITTGAVCDVLMRRGMRRYMRCRIRPLDLGVRLAGPALTARRKPVELLPRNAERPRDRFVEILEGAAPGSVIVVVSDAEREAALWGGLLAAAGGGVVVEPGDFVYGDSNGVVVVPAGMGLDVLREAISVEARDQEAAKRILSGAGLLETMNALGRA